MRFLWLCINSILFFYTQAVYAETQVAFNKANSESTLPLRIASASNFSVTLKKLLPQFSAQTQIKTQMISAASGVLYQQIQHGAPFDIYLSADKLRPQKLVNDNLAYKQSLKTYAYGKLVLWSATQKINSLTPLNNLVKTHKRLAIANPKIAPYGIAAQDVLTTLALWTPLKSQLITGNNINQTFQQVQSKNVELGLIAFSQLTNNKQQAFIIPEHLYSPIAQSSVILKRSKQKKNAEIFQQFLLSPAIQKQISESGYAVSTNREAVKYVL